MRGLVSGVISFGLLGLAMFLSAIAGVDCVMPMVVVTSIWVALDSKKLELKKYKSGISHSPGVLLVLCLALWIVGFPWYLTVRGRIKSGTAELKEA